MNKLRITYRSRPIEVFEDPTHDLSIQFPVIANFKVNGTLVDSNIELVFEGLGTARDLIVKEYDLDLTKNFDKLEFTLGKITVHYEQVPGLGFQSATEDRFLSDAEYDSINAVTRNFTTAEVLKVEYSEDGGVSYQEFNYEGCYTYLVPGGLFNGMDLASEMTGAKIEGSTRQKLTVPEMMNVANQIGLPYTNEGMPILDRADLGFDAYTVINYTGQPDVSAIVAAEDQIIDQFTCISVYNPV